MGSRPKATAQRIRVLIEQHRKLAGSSNAFERIFGTLLIAGELSKHLARVSDRALGTLMFRHVWDCFQVTSPEMQISIEATRRLLRARKRVRQ